MQERFDNLEGASEDPEATLVTPRFDAEEARRAHPVVPLAEADASYGSTHVRWRRGPRRSWPTALIAVVMLAAVATAGVVATKVMRRSYPTAPAQTQAAPAQTEGMPRQDTPAQVQTTQAETAPAPSTTNDAPGPEETSAATQPPREEARAKRPSRTPRESREREGEAGVLAAPAEILRRAAADSDEDEDRGGRDREKRRERDDDEAEKRMHKALKHSKSKVPRLVDVIVNPRHED
ncbi:MAG TPA: hypothetical protein VJ866_22440 [Pyrinomonadaceae bacterium]|nr:hypothetical protein [Pyrinomonadaceae bacterium]